MLPLIILLRLWMPELERFAKTKPPRRFSPNRCPRSTAAFFNALVEDAFCSTATESGNYRNSPAILRRSRFDRRGHRWLPDTRNATLARFRMRQDSDIRCVQG